MTANSIHAIVAADADVPAVLAASVAAVPPLVLLAITHLTVILTRHQPADDDNAVNTDATELHAEVTDSQPAAVMALEPALRVPVLAAPPVPEPDDLPTPDPGELPGQGEWSGREVAEVLRAGGWSNKKIARYLDVHPSTVGRWFPRTSMSTTEPEAEPSSADSEDTEAAPTMPAAATSTDEEEPS